MFQFSYLEAFWIGALQGITEFLPVSSSAHLILYSHWRNGENLPLFYNVALHFGTALAVLIYFHKDWNKLFRACVGSLPSEELSLQRSFLVKLIIASIPAGLLGLAFKGFIESNFHTVESTLLPLAFFGFVLWFVDRKFPKNRKVNEISFFEAFLLGVGQSFALIPGVSRSAASITACRLGGLGREEAIRFSFLMGTPLMIGASLLHLKDFYQSLGDPQFYMGFFSSFFWGLASIHFFLLLFKRFSFLSFALYRLLLASYLYFFVL